MADNRNNRGGKGPSENECCGFCGAKRDDVDLLLTSGDHRLNICNNCIAEGYRMLVSSGIIEGPQADSRRRRKSEFAAPQTMDELLRPAQIKEFLDNYVIGQESAKR